MDDNKSTETNFTERRPDEWTICENGELKEVNGAEMCLADWYSLYDHVASGKPPKGGIPFEGKGGGYFKKRGKPVYYLFVDDLLVKKDF